MTVMTNAQHKRRQRDMALFRDCACRYWQDKTKSLRQELDDAEWEGVANDKLETLREAWQKARQRRDKLMTND